MGGCYNDDYSSYNRSSSNVSKPKKQRSKPNPEWQQDLKTFSKMHEITDLIGAYKGFFRYRTRGGFFGKLAAVCGVSNVTDIPKEFPTIEYEIKFDVQPSFNSEEVRVDGLEEPSIVEYLNAFDFPASNSARFLKDPVNHVSKGTNHFIGDSLDERIVIIEKGGKQYIKEKGLVTPLNTSVPYERVVIKRTESRYGSTMEDIIKKLREAGEDVDVKYRGKIRKEKGDAFILDTNDGRIYSMSFTRAHLIKPGDATESNIQRQLEFEYAGYIPGFKVFEKDSEKQIVEGMVSLAKYVSMMYHDAPITQGWYMKLGLTNERKYDFIMEKRQRKLGDSLEIFDSGFARKEKLLVQRNN